MKHVMHYILTGLAILIAAIVVNIGAGAAGLTLWYSYLNQIQSVGFAQATQSAGAASLLFLYFVYPLILGLVGGKTWSSVSS